MRRLIAAVLLASLLVPAFANAQTATGCAAGQAPAFVFGFADLKSQIGDAMGDPVTCEFPDPNGTGDVHQRTTTGLAFWRKFNNIATFTGGYEHWAVFNGELVYWLGTAIDPPGAPVPPPPTATPTALPTNTPLPTNTAVPATSTPVPSPTQDAFALERAPVVEGLDRFDTLLDRGGPLIAGGNTNGIRALAEETSRTVRVNHLHGLYVAYADFLYACGDESELLGIIRIANYYGNRDAIFMAESRLGPVRARITEASGRMQRERSTIRSRFGV